MKPEDRKAFAEILLGFAELKGKQLSKGAVDLFWSAMQDWRIEDFRAAAHELLRTCEFFPTPRDFEQLRRAGRDTAGEAFAAALEHVRSGEWRSGSTGDPSLDRAVAAIGGWQTLAMSDDEGLRYLERRFSEHYETIQDAEDTREALPQIAGSFAPRRLNGRGPRSIRDLLPQLEPETP